VFPPILTDRQFEILQLIYEGATRSEIAETLDISPETVKAHTKVVLKKFGEETVRGEVKEIVVGLRSESPPSYVRINGMIPKRENQAGDMRNYIYEFDPPIKQGERCEFNNEMRYAEMSDLKTRNVVELIRFPTQRFKSEILFTRKIPNSLQIKEFSAKGTLDVVHDLNVPIEIRGKSVSFELEWPDVGNRYAFVWDWLD